MDLQHRKNPIQNQIHHCETHRITKRDKHPLPLQLHGSKQRLQPLTSHEDPQSNAKNMIHYKQKRPCQYQCPFGCTDNVARNYISSLIWRCYDPKQYILDYWVTIIYCLLSYYMLSKGKVYRVNTMDMGRSHWNNGAIRTFLISISTTVLIV